jgi:hypothetical protein
MKKWGDLQLALQLGFWIAMTICNSFATQHISMNMSVIGQVAWIATNATHYMWNYTHMQHMQFKYNYVGISNV